MQIRQATPADLDAIAPLFDAYRVFYGQPADLPRARTFLADKLEHARSTIFLALTDDGAPAGFTQLYPTFSSVRTQPALILNDLYVAPAARGQGLATALLTAAADHGRTQGCARLTLSTAIDNHAAQALYERAGWTRDEAFVSFGLGL